MDLARLSRAIRRYQFLATGLASVGVLMAAGCGQPWYPNALGATLEQVDLIRNSDTLEPQEKRDELARLLGIEDPNDPNSAGAVLLNGLLQGERLANQFGAEYSPPLLSAYNKVNDNEHRRMTPDEVQYYGDATDQTTLDDAEAQAIADLFRELFPEGTLDDETDWQDLLTEYLDDPATELPPEIDEVNLRSVFIETDPDYVRDKL